MALTDKLSAIGDAIRSKSGTTELMTLDEMPAAIEAIETGGGECSGMHIPEEALTITGDCSNRFAYGGWDWFIEELEDKIVTKDIVNSMQMFSGSGLSSIPFDFNFTSDGGNVSSMFSGCYNLTTVPAIDFNQTTIARDCSNVFAHCQKLIEIGTLSNMYPTGVDSMFSGCNNLRYLPSFENFNNSYLSTNNYSSCSSLFKSCYSLRSIPEDFLKELYSPKLTSYYYSVFNYGFYDCYALDEIRGLNPQTGTMTSNMFSSTFNNCHRLKEVIFATQEDGTPYTVSWKSQVIDLSKEVGYENHTGAYYNILHYNAGLGPATQVFEDTTYQERKNHPDWWTGYVTYSRYNRTSAVNTINSLPDTSAYLAANGGTNTIKFYGAAGASTDGGAIRTLTEEEIAVATAKGWTVSFA